MGVVDKLKKILFDEEDVEIPVNSDELPERELRIVADKLEKKVASRSSNSNTKKEVEPTRSFKNYHEYEEEDTIVELKVPVYDEEEEEKEEKKPSVPEKRIKFPIDDFDDDDDYIPTRSSREEEPKKSVSRTENSKIPKYINDLANEKKEPREEKDYRKIIHDLDDENKKPFEVTPIISPVFGVLNKNYKQEELETKKALITQVNSGAKPRMYGPVSYNDAPLPKPPVFEAKKTGLKEELVELNSTISDLINDDKNVDESEIEMPAKIVPDIIPEYDLAETIDIPKIANYQEEEDLEEDDMIIETENYDEIPSSIEKSSKGHTSIEDAFEPTSEFAKINDYDHEVEKRNIEEELDEEELIEDEPEETYEEDIVASYKIEEEDFEDEEVSEEPEIEEDEEEEEVKEKKTSTKKRNVRKPVDIEEIIEEDEKNDDDHLTDTIETDLFNLIDSMYKDDEEDEEEDDE